MNIARIPVKWKSKVRFCPHCGTQLYIEAESTSERDVIESIFKLLNRHKKVCKNYKGPIRFDLSMQTRNEFDFLIKMYYTKLIF